LNDGINFKSAKAARFPPHTNFLEAEVAALRYWFGPKPKGRDDEIRGDVRLALNSGARADIPGPPVWANNRQSTFGEANRRRSRQPKDKPMEECGKKYLA
jgi:hypothetical protein